jgi:hypothetical protein
MGVSFGLPGGYGGAYPLNPLGGPNPVVNPYQDGIPFGPININPLVSFQKGKDKHKTKIFRPLVNLHITPNIKLLRGIKGFFGKGNNNNGYGGGGGGGGGWGWAPEYNYGNYQYYPQAPASGWGQTQSIPIAVPYPVPVPVPSSPVEHHHDHYHAYSKPSTSYVSSYPVTSSGIISGPGWGSGSAVVSSGYGVSSSGYGSGYGSGGYGSGGYSSSGPISPYYKYDKIGASSSNWKPGSSTSVPLSNSGGGFLSGITNFLSGSGGGAGSSGGEYSTSSGNKNQASGLTPSEESLLNTLLKEEEADGLDTGRGRAESFSQDDLEQSRTRGGRTLFPDQKSNSIQSYSNSRLPPHASSIDSNSNSNQSNQIVFPSGRSNNDGQEQHQQQTSSSKVTFPSDGRRDKRDVSATNADPNPLPEARIRNPYGDGEVRR